MQTADQIYEKSDTLLDEISTEDKVSWLRSDVTKALLIKLEADRVFTCESWIDGGYTSDTIDKTSQLNAKALGSVQYLLGIHNWITSIVEE